MQSRFCRIAHDFLGAATLLVAFAGCNVGANPNQLPPQIKAALDEPDSFVLYSLKPESGDPSQPGDDESFHNYPILGSTEVTDPAERKKLLDALYHGIAENDGMVAGCFNPRHGIRVQAGGKTFDLVICFECMSAIVYVDDQRSAQVLLTSSAQPTFDAALEAAQVPLPQAAQ